MTQIRIAAVQYDPQFRDVQGNIQHVNGMIDYLTPELVDILLLPEMAFTGYMFANREEINPFLEHEDGPSIKWAQETAKRLESAVVVGYPELDKVTGKAFNSMAVVDDSGCLQTIYRKHFLYDTDKTWASEGPSFQTFELQLKALSEAITVAPGICMDLNPKYFIAPFELFEFASHAQASRAQLVLCCMNWLVSELAEDDDTVPNNAVDDIDVWADVKETISYFALRMAPMIGSNAIFVGSNRVGTERGTTFTGSSCVMKLGERPVVLEYAGKAGEEVLLSTVEIPQRSDVAISVVRRLPDVIGR